VEFLVIGIAFSLNGRDETTSPQRKSVHETMKLIHFL
jgi:hypothetical protein